MKRLPIRLLLTALLLAFSTGPRSAELVMGVEDLPYLPYYSVDRGEYNGFARELFDAFAQEKGHHIRYRPLPVERLYRELLDGRIDLKFPDNPEWRKDLKTDKPLRYSQPVAACLDGVMASRKRISTPTRLPSRIGTIRGFTPWALLEEIEKGNVELSENNSISGLLRQTLEGRLDGAYINVAVASFHLKNMLHQESALRLDERLPYRRSFYFVSSIRNLGIIRELDTWLEQSAERVTALQRKWGIEYRAGRLSNP